MPIKQLALSALLSLSSLTAIAPAEAQQLYLGQIITGGWTFCPRGTAEADGRLLNVSQNQALFALFGTIYGGDGRNTFALPDLRGRAIVGEGTGPGLSTKRLGEKGPDRLLVPQEGEQRTPEVTPYLATKICVVTEGIFPSRS